MILATVSLRGFVFNERLYSPVKTRSCALVLFIRGEKKKDTIDRDGMGFF